MSLLLRVLGLAAIVLVGAAAFSPLSEMLAHRLAVASRPGPADAIVVLGAGVDQHGLLSNASLRRMLEGVLLQKQDLAPFLVLLGPSFHGSPPEASVRARLAARLGVASERILTVEDAWTTREEAAKSWALLAPRGARRVLLVTDGQHLVRAVPLFERRGFEVRPVAAEETSLAPRSPEQRLKLARMVAEEILARAYHRLAGYL